MPMKRNRLAVVFGGLALLALAGPAEASPAMLAQARPPIASPAAIHPAGWIYRHGRREWYGPRWHYHPWHPRWHHRDWHHGYYRR